MPSPAKGGGDGGTAGGAPSPPAELVSGGKHRAGMQRGPPPNPALEVFLRSHNSWFRSRRLEPDDARLGRPLWPTAGAPAVVIPVGRQRPPSSQLAFGSSFRMADSTADVVARTYNSASVQRRHPTASTLTSANERPASAVSHAQASFSSARPTSGSQQRRHSRNVKLEAAFNYASSSSTPVPVQKNNHPRSARPSAAAEYDDSDDAGDDAEVDVVARLPDFGGATSGRPTTVGAGASGGGGAGSSCSVVAAYSAASTRTYRTARFSTDALSVWTLVSEKPLTLNERIREEMAKMNSGGGTAATATTTTLINSSSTASAPPSTLDGNGSALRVMPPRHGSVTVLSS